MKSGVQLPKVAFSSLPYDELPVGSFFIGFDLDNNSVLSKIDKYGVITTIEFNGNTLPTIIDDIFVSNLYGDGEINIKSDLILEPASYTSGTPVNFVRPNFSPLTIDIIESGVTEISRANGGGAIFNSAQEGSYSFGSSPIGTEWNSIFTDPIKNGFGNLTDLASRTYSDFASALNNEVGLQVLTTPLIMHDLSTDKYYTVEFTSWTTSGGGGGFAYTRTEITIIPSAKITFPDGNSQNFAARKLLAGAGISINETIDAEGVVTAEIEAAGAPALHIIYVDPVYGDNTLASANPYGGVPFKNLGLVENYAAPGDFVYVLPGDHILSSPLKLSNVYIYCAKGATVYNPSGPIVDLSGTAHFTVRGHGKFMNFGFASPLFSMYSGAYVDIECDELIHDGGSYAILIGSGSATSRIKANKMHSVGGRGDLFYILDKHILYVECPEMIYSRIAVIIEDQSTGATKCFVKGNFIAEDNEGDFTLFAPTLVLFFGATSLGAEVNIDGNHSILNTVVPLAASAIMNMGTFSSAKLKGEITSRTASGCSVSGDAILEITGRLEENKGNAINGAGDSKITVNGRVYATNSSTDQHVVSLSGTSTFVSMYAHLVTTNNGGTAYSITGPATATAKYAQLVSNYGTDGVVSTPIIGSTSIIDTNVE